MTIPVGDPQVNPYPCQTLTLQKGVGVSWVEVQVEVWTPMGTPLFITNDEGINRCKGEGCDRDERNGGESNEDKSWEDGGKVNESKGSSPDGHRVAWSMGSEGENEVGCGRDGSGDKDEEIG